MVDKDSINFTTIAIKIIHLIIVRRIKESKLGLGMTSDSTTGPNSTSIPTPTTTLASTPSSSMTQIL